MLAVITQPGMPSCSLTPDKMTETMTTFQQICQNPSKYQLNLARNTGPKQSPHSYRWRSCWWPNLFPRGSHISTRLKWWNSHGAWVSEGGLVPPKFGIW